MGLWGGVVVGVRVSWFLVGVVGGVLRLAVMVFLWWCSVCLFAVWF